MDFKTLTNLTRFKDILIILIKYGFEDLVERLELPTGLIKKIHRTSRPDLDTYERIRCALEDLGPTFVKFGQIMSLRPDLLPEPLIRELSKLQDDVEPEESGEIRGVLDENLGRPLEEVFSIFDAEPVAAASLSQVHRAVLREEGLIVSLKIQRPGIYHKIQTDLDILESIAVRLHHRSEELQAYDLPDLVRVTRRNLLRELDFKREARYMTIARFNLAEAAEISIPRVYDRYCTPHLLVMEFIQGSRLRDLDTQRLEDPEGLAKQGLRAAIKQILEDGFFHADPHPGNLLITSGGGLCLLDWGLVGRLTDSDRFELIDLLRSLMDRDTKGMVGILLSVTSGGGDTDPRALEREILELLDFYFTVPLKSFNLGELLLQITGLIRDYRLRMPPDFVIMAKALVTAEGTARKIYPDLNIMSEAEEYVRKLAGERYRPSTLFRNLRSSLTQTFFLHRHLPRHVARIFNKIDQGQLSLRFEHQNLDALQKTLENIFSRLTFGIIIAAMIIGSSMIITTGMGPLFLGLPVLGIVGYLISALIGLWLIFNMIRSRKY